MEIVEGSDIKNILFENYRSDVYVKETVNMYGVNFMDDDNINALMWACGVEDVDLVRLLLKDKNINVNLYGRKRSTPLLVACYGDENDKIIEIVRMLLGVKGIDVNFGGVFGRTALTWAQIRGNDKIIEMLEEAGGKI